MDNMNNFNDNIEDMDNNMENKGNIDQLPKQIHIPFCQKTLLSTLKRL